MMFVVLDLLLITGAGASRNLGVRNSQLPLMGHWAKTLCKALDQREAGLASACQLDPKHNGPEFEQAIGELLEWARVRRMEEKFAALANDNLAGQTKPAIAKARSLTERRLTEFRRALDETLYEQFSHKAVDDNKATQAYSTLLAQLKQPKLVLATTNYDRSAESALHRLGLRIRNGFSGEPPRRQLFTPGNLVEGAEKREVPILHLHGAVGWYAKGGEVVLENAEDGFDPNRGTPVVLYPDPHKEPLTNAIVGELWREFDIAIDNTSRVLVLGHSLHDQMLVERLQNLSRKQKLVVSAYSSEDYERITELLPSAMIFKVDFTPGASIDRSAAKHLVGG